MSFFAPNLAKSGHFQKEKDIFSLNFAKSVEARILPVDEDRSFLIQVLAKILTVAVFLVTSIAIFFFSIEMGIKNRRKMPSVGFSTDFRMYASFSVALGPQ